MRILLAEDEKELSDAIVQILKHNNYSCDAVYNGLDAYTYASGDNYDAVILDIMMPGMNGIEVLRKLRAENVSTPVLFLTARSRTEDKILGLDAGADDYLSKPFSMGEMLARLRAITRRRSELQPEILEFADICLNKSTFELSGKNKAFRLSSKEFQMMEMLMANPGVLISTERFMEKIWGYDSSAEINVVWVYISYLRKKMAEIGSKTNIKAVRGVGYFLEEEK